MVNHEVMNPVPEELFETSYHEQGAARNKLGRGSVIMFRYNNIDMVLKTYRRGGLPARFIRGSYFYNGIEKTRMWQEFYLLQELGRLGLPVPTPLAVRCQLMSPFSYRGEILLEKITESRTLAEVIASEALPERLWERVGQTIADFHEQRVFHADLNANNILLRDDGDIFLIDFDKCFILSERSAKSDTAQQSNLTRLQRSLKKLAGKLPGMHYSEDKWQLLNAAYKQRRGFGQGLLLGSFLLELFPALLRFA